ncbi:MAG: hypothetical protein ACP5NS_02605 [Candidatus Pacearchaeota archaeon]
MRMSEQVHKRKVQGEKNIPIKKSSAEIKSKILSMSPVKINKLFMNKIPPKNMAIGRMRGIPKIIASRVIEAKRSINPSILTII